MNAAHLILFTRAPTAGHTKSRLAAELGDEAAKDLHVACLLDLIDSCERFHAERKADALNTGTDSQAQPKARKVEPQTQETEPQARKIEPRAQKIEPQMHLFITPPGSEAVFAREGVEWGGHVQVHAQSGKDLAERMGNAFAEVLRDEPEHTPALLMGADLPLLDQRHLHQALEALNDADVVFGGTHDGGYYLVGMRGLIPRVFQLKRWKEGEVLSDSLALGAARGFSIALIDTLPDVDTAQDLALVRAHPLFAEMLSAENSSRRAVRFIAELPGGQP